MMRAALRLLFVAMFALLTAGPHVLAQGDSSSVYSTARPGANARGPLDWLFGRRVAPANRADAGARTYQPRKRTTTAPRTPANPASMIGPPIPPELLPQPGEALPQVADGAPAAPVSPQLPPVHVAVLGDSLSVFLAQGLQDIYSDRPSVTFQRRHREASGLVREDYFDWPKAMREVLDGPEKLHAVVMMVGSNDRQQLRDASGAHDVRTDRWRELYMQRIDALTVIAKAKNLPMFLVGLPIMRSERYSADLIAFNEMFKARATAAGATYIDTWEAFTGDDGQYTVNGPDVGGEIVRLRTADGVHFTKAGARKLAFFVDKELQKIVAGVQASLVPEIIAPTPQPIMPGTGPQVMAPSLPDPKLPPALQSIDAILGVPLPDRPLPTALTPRPAQGAIVSLTAPARAQGGHLLSGAIRFAPEVGEVYQRGQLPPAKPGRLDDFRIASQ